MTSHSINRRIQDFTLNNHLKNNKKFNFNRKTKRENSDNSKDYGEMKRDILYKKLRKKNIEKN